MLCFAALARSVDAETAPSPPVPLDDDGFTSYVASTFLQAIPGWNGRIAHPLMIEFKSPGKAATMTFSLARIHDACVAAPSNCTSIVSDFVEGWRTASAPPPPAVPTNLWASVIPGRRSHYLAPIGSDGSQAISRPFVGQLDIVCEIDPTRPGPLLGQKSLESLNLSADAALDLCVANTVGRQKPFADQLPDAAAGDVQVIRSPEVVALLLAHDAWAPLARRFGGELLVASPDSDTIYYGRGSDAAAIAAVQNRAYRQVADANPKAPAYAALCCEVYKWTPAGWDVVAKP